MKFCTNCGNRLEDTAKFCTVCGTPCASPVPQETVDAGQTAHVEPAVFDTPATVAPSPEAPQASIPEENRPQSKQGRTAFIFALTCVLAVPGFIISLIDVVKNDKRYRHGLAIAALIISGLMIAACVIGIASCNSKAKAAEQKLEDSWEELYREELAKEEADIAAEKEAKASATPAPTEKPAAEKKYSAAEIAPELEKELKKQIKSSDGDCKVIADGNKIYIILYVNGVQAACKKAMEGDSQSLNAWNGALEELKNWSVKTEGLFDDINTDATIYWAIGNEKNKTEKLAIAYNGSVTYDAVKESKSSSSGSSKGEQTTEASKKSATVSTKYGDVNADLKEFLDSYEEYLDSIIEMYKKVAAGDMSAMLSYASAIAKLADLAEKADSWKNDDLKGADLKYYTEVMGRITKKLTQIAF